MSEEIKSELFSTEPIAALIFVNGIIVEVSQDFFQTLSDHMRTLNKNRCGARTPQEPHPFICTREKGHNGAHVAHYEPTGNAVAVYDKLYTREEDR